MKLPIAASCGVLNPAWNKEEKIKTIHLKTKTP